MKARAEDTWNTQAPVTSTASAALRLEAFMFILPPWVFFIRSSFICLPEQRSRFGPRDDVVEVVRAHGDRDRGREREPALPHDEGVVTRPEILQRERSIGRGVHVLDDRRAFLEPHDRRGHR